MSDISGLEKPHQNRDPHPPTTLQRLHDFVSIRTAISQSTNNIHEARTFLDLPTEIRHQIYTDFFTEEEINAKKLHHGP